MGSSSSSGDGPRQQLWEMKLYVHTPPLALGIRKGLDATHFPKFIYQQFHFQFHLKCKSILSTPSIPCIPFVVVFFFFLFILILFL